MRDLGRLIAPESIAVIGGGKWCEAIAGAARTIGFAGPVWPVHPGRERVAGLPAFASVADLPGPPDAAFIGVNRQATPGIVAALRRAGAGGAVCFASGFNEVGDGAALNDALLAAAGGMPILGPNCYGLINALDRAAVWPDQHGLRPVGRGVAILTQSSNIALNLTMQRRGLPIGFVGTLGNQAQTGLAELAGALSADPRITALGLHVEGVADAQALHELSLLAKSKGKPIVALKAGRTEAARSAAVSHTAAMTGTDDGADALFAHCGIARVDGLEVFLDTLKLLHLFGPLPGARLASLSCSGGEAALIADTAAGRGVTFPPLSARQRAALSDVLGPKVTISNPLDYHTYIWRDSGAMARCFAAMADPCVDLVAVIADWPHEGRCDASDWACISEALIAAARRTGARFALLSSLAEGLPEALARDLHAAGVATLCGFRDGLDAIAATARAGSAASSDAPWRAVAAAGAVTLTEAEAKARLRGFGIEVPRGEVVGKAQAGDAARRIGGPVALKAQGLAHKSGAGGIVLGVAPDRACSAAQSLPGDRVLVEEMVPPGVELLVGVLADPAHGLVLTLGAGGTMAELLDDRTCLLLPATRARIAGALRGLRLSRLLDGWRGAPKIPLAPVLDAIEAVQRFAGAQAGRLVELEINPLICTPGGAVAADALLRINLPEARSEAPRDRRDSAG